MVTTENFQLSTTPFCHQKKIKVTSLLASASFLSSKPRALIPNLWIFFLNPESKLQGNMRN